MEQQRCTSAHKITQFLKYTMNPVELRDTVYLGDRYIKSIFFDEKNRIVKIQINEISRVRGSGWNFYNAENIIDGFIVCEGVKKYIFNPAVVNETHSNLDIDGMFVKDLCNNTFEIIFPFYYYASGQRDGQEIVLTIIASDMYLEDPAKPGVKIRD